MAKKTTTTKSPRLLRRGDVVRVPLPQGGETEEVVRGIDIIVHLANGNDVVVNSADDITLVNDSEVTEELQAQLQEMLDADAAASGE